MQSNYTRLKIENHILGGAAWTPPTSYTFKLMTTMPDGAGAGSAQALTAWTNYADVTLTNNTTNFPTTTTAGAGKANAGILDFGTATVPGLETIAIAGMAVYDQLGNLISYKAGAFQVVNGQSVTIPIGQLTFTETAGT